jgi:hypothetical protein
MLVLFPHPLWIAPALIRPRSPPSPLFQVLAKLNQDSPLPLASSAKPMSTDAFSSIFNHTLSKTSVKKGGEDFYKNNFIHEITFASTKKALYIDRSLPIIDTTDMSDWQKMPDS